MRKSLFSEDEILGILREADVGLKPKEVCRRHAISQQTFYRWRTQFVGQHGANAKLHCLEVENRRLKQVVAELSLDNQALKAVLTRKNPNRRWEKYAASIVKNNSE
jgi:putative transposase